MFFISGMFSLHCCYYHYSFVKLWLFLNSQNSLSWQVRKSDRNLKDSGTISGYCLQACFHSNSEETIIICRNNTKHKIIMETLFRSSRPEVFCKDMALKNFAKFTGTHRRGSLFLIKYSNFIKKETDTGVSLWVLRKFITTVFFADYLWWLLPTFNSIVFMHFKQLLDLGTGPLCQILLFCL